MFHDYSWPGNVRELENNIKRFIILGNEAQLIAEFTRKRENGTYLSFPDMNGRGGHRPEPEPAPVVAAAPVRKGNGEQEILFPDKATLKEVSKIAQRNAERDLIDRVLRQTRWNRRKAAQILDISYKALLYKIKECGLNQD